MGKDADTKVETKTVIATAVADEDEGATDEWEEMICSVTEYRKRWQQLTDEKDAAQAQKTVLAKRVFDLQSEIRLLEAKILLEFEHVTQVSWGAPQMIIIAEGQLNAVD